MMSKLTGLTLSLVSARESGGCDDCSMVGLVSLNYSTLQWRKITQRLVVVVVVAIMIRATASMYIIKSACLIREVQIARAEARDRHQANLIGSVFALAGLVH